jgi:RNA polymerase sigma factor (sigma-70 family)
MTIARVKTAISECCTSGEPSGGPTQQKRVMLQLARLAEGTDARAAEAEIFHALWPSLVKFAAKSLNNAADAEEVAQTTIIKIFRQAGAYDGYSAPIAWARAIASFEVQVVRRSGRRRREVDLTGMEEQESLELSVEQRLMIRDRQRVVRAALKKLSDMDRRALLGEESADAAKKAALRKRKQRALARLRQALSACADVDALT